MLSGDNTKPDFILFPNSNAFSFVSLYVTLLQYNNDNNDDDDDNVTILIVLMINILL